MKMSTATPQHDEVLVAMWRKWRRIRAEENRAWNADYESRADERPFELSAAVRNLSDLIVSLRPRSVTGLVVQLRVLSTAVCQTPPEQLKHADIEEKWFRTILASAELLADGSLPPWNVDEDAMNADPDK
jgi:hypothetical protein